MEEEEIDQYNDQTIDLLDDLDSCILRIQYSIEQSESIDYEFGLAYAQYLKGYVHRMQDELGKAFLANLKGLHILEGVNDERAPETQLRLHINTGEILQRHFKFSEAIKYYSEGLKIAKSHEKLENWIADLNYNIAVSYQSKGDLQMAMEYVNEAYKSAKDENDENILINAVNLAGLIFKDNHAYDSAIFSFNKMLKHVYDNLDANKYKGRAYHNLANTYAEQGDTSKAISCFLKALEHKKIRNSPQQLFITQNDLAELYFLKGDYYAAHDWIEQCLEHYGEMRLDPDHYKVYDMARKISSVLGNPENVDRFANRYFDENKKFIQQQEKLIEIRDQFKMELLTASFFVELERNERIEQLNNVIIFISFLFVLSILFIKLRQMWVNKTLQKELQFIIQE